MKGRAREGGRLGHFASTSRMLSPSEGVSQPGGAGRCHQLKDRGRSGMGSGAATRAEITLRMPPGKGVPQQASFPPRERQILTVDVLDEAGGAGHIIHFELSQGCTGRPRGRPVARRRDADGNPPLTCTSNTASRRKRFRLPRPLPVSPVHPPKEACWACGRRQRFLPLSSVK